METLLRYLQAIFNVTLRFFSNDFVIIILFIIGAYSVADGLARHILWIEYLMAGVFFLGMLGGAIGLAMLIWDAIKKEAERLKNG